ncbi:MAG TPA: hypothetical protein VND94_15285 [Terriglobia bacterium]|nr:hypothetical protein [Terriglobia bacterium]
MADKVKVAHIVIAFDSYGEQRRVINAAMDIAKGEHAKISGIFIHDPLVRQALEQPLTQYVSSPAAPAVAFDRPALEAHFSAIAGRLRLSLEAKARENALSCTFEIVSDCPFIPPRDADLLITQAGAPFIGQTRRRLAQLIETTAQTNQSILLIRREIIGKRVVVLVNSLSEASGRAVAWAGELTRHPGQQLWIQAAGLSLQAVRQWLFATAPEIATRAELTQATPGRAKGDLPAGLADGDVLILNLAATAAPLELKALLANTRADLLLIR